MRKMRMTIMAIIIMMVTATAYAIDNYIYVKNSSNVPVSVTYNLTISNKSGKEEKTIAITVIDMQPGESRTLDYNVNFSKKAVKLKVLRIDSSDNQATLKWVRQDDDIYIELCPMQIWLKGREMTKEKALEVLKNGELQREVEADGIHKYKVLLNGEVLWVKSRLDLKAMMEEAKQ